MGYIIDHSFYTDDPTWRNNYGNRVFRWMRVRKSEAEDEYGSEF